MGLAMAYSSHILTAWVRRTLLCRATSGYTWEQNEPAQAGEAGFAVTRRAGDLGFPLEDKIGWSE